MHQCKECEVEMYEIDEEKRSDLEDRRRYECPECGNIIERAKYRNW